MSYPDDFATYGFLTGDPERVLASSHPAHAERMERAREEFRQALAELPFSRTYTARPGTTAALAFWLRTLEGCQASIILCDLGMPGAAAATVRTAFECLFHFCALLKDPDLYVRLNAAHDHEVTLQAQQLKKIEGLDLPEDIQQKLAKASEGDRGMKWSAHDVAEAAGLKPLYESVWRGMGALGAHATERSLDRHFEELPDGRMSMTYAPDFRNLEIILAPVVICLQIGRQRLHEQINPAALEPPSQE